MKPVKAVTFDCYGSLVDWEAGVRDFVARLLSRPTTNPAARPSPDDWMVKWQRIRRQLLRPYRPWRELLVRSYDATMQQLDLEAFVDEGPALARHLASLEPRPEARAILKRLAKKYRLALVANPDHESLAQCVGRLQAPFSSVVTADEVKAYKPDPKLFSLLLERLRLAASEVLHVAVSVEEELVPARSLGIQTALIGVASSDADLTAPSLSALAEIL